MAWIEDKTEPLTKLLANGALDAALVALEATLGVVEHAVVAKDPFVLVMRRDIHSRASAPTSRARGAPRH